MEQLKVNAERTSLVDFYLKIMHFQFKCVIIDDSVNPGNLKEYIGKEGRIGSVETTYSGKDRVALTIIIDEGEYNKQKEVRENMDFVTVYSTDVFIIFPHLIKPQ